MVQTWKTEIAPGLDLAASRGRARERVEAHAPADSNLPCPQGFAGGQDAQHLINTASATAAPPAVAAAAASSAAAPVHVVVPVKGKGRPLQNQNAASYQGQPGDVDPWENYFNDGQGTATAPNPAAASVAAANHPTVPVASAYNPNYSGSGNYSGGGATAESSASGANGASGFAAIPQWSQCPVALTLGQGVLPSTMLGAAGGVTRERVVLGSYSAILI